MISLEKGKSPDSHTRYDRKDGEVAAKKKMTLGKQKTTEGILLYERREAVGRLSVPPYRHLFESCEDSQMNHKSLTGDFSTGKYHTISLIPTSQVSSGRPGQCKQLRRLLRLPSQSEQNQNQGCCSDPKLPLLLQC